MVMVATGRVVRARTRRASRQQEQGRARLDGASFIGLPFQAGIIALDALRLRKRVLPFAFQFIRKPEGADKQMHGCDPLLDFR